MGAPASLVTACARFAAEVSAGACERVIQLLEDSEDQRAISFLGGPAAERLQMVMVEWQQAGTRADRTTVVNLLRGACAAVARERLRQQVELVWSGPMPLSSTLRSTEPALLELIDGAVSSIYVVAFAAYKVPRVTQALARAAERGVRLVFVLESNEVSGGKVEFDAYPHLAGSLKGIEAYIWPTSERVKDAHGRFGSLHAKFAIADRARLLVSSANLTEYAFNLNIELGAFISGGTAPSEAAEQLDELIRRGVFRPVLVSPKT